MAVITRNGIEGKVCSTCGQWKPLSEFSPGGKGHGASQGGKHCRCKECHRREYHKRQAIIRRAKELGIA